jgi:ABC-type lipoprotein export system ATPase subunit
MALFQGIAERQSTTFIIVSHDPMIVEFVNQAYDLNDGKLAPHQSQVLTVDGTGKQREHA